MIPYGHPTCFQVNILHPCQPLYIDLTRCYPVLEYYAIPHQKTQFCFYSRLIYFFLSDQPTRAVKHFFNSIEEVCTPVSAILSH